MTDSETTPQTTRRQVDAVVGKRIREKRVGLGITQEILGQRLGISYQQIQKYETGANRLSAGRLWEIGLALKTDVREFFADLDPSRSEVLPHGAKDRMTLEIVRAFEQIAEQEVRTAVLGLVRAIAVPVGAAVFPQ